MTKDIARITSSPLKLFIAVFLIAVVSAQVTQIYAADYTSYQKHMIRNINGQRALDDIKVLASPAFEGRLAGDTGQYMAAEYIADQFAEYGILPAGDDGTYYQTFTYPFWHAYPPVELASPSTTWTYGTDYVIFSYSGSVNVADTEVIFAGYGLTMPASFNYDDYVAIDVTGKIVLVFRHGPNDDYSWNVAAPDMCPSPLIAFNFGCKAWNAYNHGAVGMILVNDYLHGPALGSGTLTANGYVATFGAIWADRTSVAESLLPNLQALQNLIDSTLTPASTSTGKTVSMTVTTDFDPARDTMNVLGVIPGTDSSLKDEVVIVSAHYDHLGVGPVGEIYYGADDDASGTACMLEIARVMGSVGLSVRPKRTILFAAWTAEEEGLIGSYYYVGNPKYPLENTVAVIQLDMVGIGTLGLNVYEGIQFPELYSIVENAGNVVGVPTYPMGVSTGTDSYPFYLAGVEAIFFQTTGLHPYFHTPQDAAATISRELLLQTARVAGLTAWATANDVAIMAPNGLTTPYLEHKQTVTPPAQSTD